MESRLGPKPQELSTEAGQDQPEFIQRTKSRPADTSELRIWDG